MIMMVKQNISMERKISEKKVGYNSRKSFDTTPVYKASVSTSDRKVLRAKKGPTFLNVYTFPVVLLNLMLLGWDVISTHIAQGWSIYLGYAVIVTVSLYLYLAYLDHFFNSY
jgi:hypothetical protein